MNPIRKIKQAMKSQPTREGAGVHLKRAFGFSEVPGLDPFLLQPTAKGSLTLHLKFQTCGLLRMPSSTTAAVASVKLRQPTSKGSAL